MLKESNSLLLHKLPDHVTEYSSHCVKPLVRVTDVCQPHIIQKDLLDDENGNSFAELGASLHNTKT